MPFIDGSVGAGNARPARNSGADVKIVQQALNQQRRPPRRPLSVDGVVGKQTIEAIRSFQSSFMKKPDGRVDPFGRTVRQLWPLAYANPTGMAPRRSDAYGQGHHGAPRGSRSHDGTDYEAIAGLPVGAPISGRVTRISKPYRSGVDAGTLGGLQIEASDGTTCQIWYLRPSPRIVGKLVRAGERLGIAHTLQNRYPPIRPPLRDAGEMTDHVHVRIHTRSGRSVDPESVIH